VAPVADATHKIGIFLVLAPWTEQYLLGDVEILCLVLTGNIYHVVQCLDTCLDAEGRASGCRKIS